MNNSKDDLNNQKMQADENITKNEKSEEVKEKICECESIEKSIFEIYSIKIINAINENRLKDAEKNLKEGLSLYPNNYNFLFYLGYIYEKQNRCLDAIVKYEMSFILCNNKELKMKIAKSIDRVKYKDYSEHEKSIIKQYRQQVYEYARQQIMFPDTKLNPNDFIKIKKPQCLNKERILFGTIEIANAMNLYSKGLRKLGYDTVTINYYPSYLDYNCDYVIDIRKVKDRKQAYYFTIDFAARMIAEYDIFHFLFNTTLTLNGADLIALKELGKKVVMDNRGSDVRMYSKAVKLNKYWQLTKECYFNKLNEEKTKETIEKLSKYIDHCFVDYELKEYVKDYYKYCHIYRLPIDLHAYPPQYENENNKKPLLVHAPTKPGVKGSKYILNALKELSAEYDFDFKVIIGKPHEEAKKIYRQADIVIDQIIGGGHGALAVEAMAMGKPVICFICDFMRKQYPEELPIVSANPDNIKEKIELLMKNPQLRKDIGKKGRKYVEKYHDYIKIAKWLTEVYSSM